MCGGGYFSLYSAAQAQELKQLGQARDSQPAILVPVVSLSLSLPSLSLTGPPAQLVLAFVTPTVGAKNLPCISFLILMTLKSLRWRQILDGHSPFSLFLLHSVYSLLFIPFVLLLSLPLTSTLDEHLLAIY